METSQAIADRLRRTLTGPMWHGDAITPLLQGVSASDAASHPVPGAHSIWDIVVHLTAWANIVRERLSLKEMRAPSAAQDWPPISTARSIEAWTDAQMRLTEAHEALAQNVEQLDASSLERGVAGHTYVVHEMLRGVVEHSLYHGGQVGLLKRALSSAAAV